MKNLYVRKIQAGEITLEDVPLRWRMAVRDIMTLFLMTADGVKWEMNNPDWRGIQ